MKTKYTPAERSKAKAITDQVIESLEDLGAHLCHESVTTSSFYVKFAEPRLRSLRIADHRGRREYRYKWNLEIGGESRVKTDRGVRRFYYNESDIQALVTHIRNYAAAIERDHGASANEAPAP